MMAATTHYLDHAATTPMLPAAVATVHAALSEVGNASSLHTSGRRARKQVEDSREQIATALGARPSEVVLTAGGTEGDNLAVKGIYWARRAADPRRRRVLVGAVEHPAVLDAAAWLATHQGAEVELLPVDDGGRLRPGAVAAAIARDPTDVALITCMWANNEVGTVQPVAEVVALANAHGIPVHSDAVQAAGALPVDFGGSGVDALTVSGHKLGGPVGTGALLVRRELDPVPLLHGGGQERDVRSGTLAVASVLGLAVALTHAVEHRAAESARREELRDLVERGVRAAVPDVHTVNAAERLPGIAHLTFDGCDGDALLMLLDARGVECSTGSACSAGVPEPSHVLLAMGRGEAAASGALRISLGRTSNVADVQAFVDAIAPVVERARAAKPTAGPVGRR
ncbi:MAG: cysteine desulfurase [Nocardioidaceae bacterium]|nr:cysteine desulfurase [Nocardioidaceae bacterium]